MPALDARRTYADGSILFESDLDAVVDDIETLLNTTLLDDDNIQDQGITASTKLVDASISSGKIATSAITTAKIADDAVTAAKVADGAIDAAAKLASDVVTTAKILDANVTTAKIADLNVTAGKLAADSVTTAKILDANVTTAKLADAHVTSAKLDAATYTSSSSSGAYSMSSGTFTDVTNLSVAVSALSRPVLLVLQGDGSGNLAGIGGDGTVELALLRDATELARYELPESSQGFSFLDPAPGSGSYTYKVQIRMASGTTAFVNRMRLIGMRLI